MLKILGKATMTNCPMSAKQRTRRSRQGMKKGETSEANLQKFFLRTNTLIFFLVLNSQLAFHVLCNGKTIWGHKSWGELKIWEWLSCLLSETSHCSLCLSLCVFLRVSPYQPSDSRGRASEGNPRQKGSTEILCSSNGQSVQELRTIWTKWIVQGGHHQWSPCRPW